MYSFRVSDSAISEFIPKVCEALIAELFDECVNTPITSDEWRVIAQDFGNKWQVHHALKAIDGKHVRIQCSSNARSIYHNYKGFHSVIVLALVDADYKFRWVDVGASGSSSDCLDFNASELKVSK